MTVHVSFDPLSLFLSDESLGFGRIARPMKRIVALLAWLCLGIPCWSQGTVNFNNNPVIFRDTIDRRVYFDFIGGAGVVGTNFVAELWYGSDANNISAVAPQVAPFFAPGDPRLGIWRGGTRTL